MKTNTTTPINPPASFELIKQNIIEAREATLPEQPRHTKRQYCPIFKSLSDKQKQIRLNINSSKSEDSKQKWKLERNKTMHEIKAQSLRNHINKIDEIAAEIQNAPDCMKMYKAVEKIKQKKYSKLIITDEDGKTMCDDKDITKRIKLYFEHKYKGDDKIQPFMIKIQHLTRPLHQMKSARQSDN